MSNFGSNGRPLVSKLLKPFGILWGSNSMDASGYAFEDGCQIMWQRESNMALMNLGTGFKILRNADY